MSHYNSRRLFSLSSQDYAKSEERERGRGVRESKMYSAYYALVGIFRRGTNSIIKNNDGYIASSIYIYTLLAVMLFPLRSSDASLRQTPGDYPGERAPKKWRERKRDRDRGRERMGNKLLPASGDNWKSYHTCCLLLANATYVRNALVLSKFSPVCPADIRFIRRVGRTPAGIGQISVRRFKMRSREIPVKFL